MYYDYYLRKHKAGVVKAYREIMYPILLSEDIENHQLRVFEELLIHHDDSKYSSEEYLAYENHHMNGNSQTEGKDDPDYMRAWNHHQKSNPHHWQYWVLLRDSESPHQIALDMPLEYIIEMICDWISASNLHDTTAHQWYASQKDHMILSDYTRKTVEHYLSKIKESENN